MSAYVPLSKNVLNSRHLSLNTRSLLAQSLIFSQVYYNLHIWCSFSDIQIHSMNVFHMRVCRKLYKFDHKCPVSDDTVQSAIRILPPAYFLRRARLLYLGRFFILAPPELMGIVSASLDSYLANNCTYSWLAALHQDICWLSARCPALEAFCGHVTFYVVAFD